MELIQSFFKNVYNIDWLIKTGGYLALHVIVFAETGLLIGFFLPGDSLLVVAGLFAARGELNVLVLLLGLSLAAIIGDTVGYAIGWKAGPRIFSREKSLLFRRDHLIKTQQFYEKHGGKTIIIARFIPILRTFAPVVAGVGQMQYRRFVSFNVFGGIGWIFSMVLIGYVLGRTIPAEVINKRIHLIVAIVIFLSLLPGIIAWLRAKMQKGPPPPPATNNDADGIAAATALAPKPSSRA